MKVIFLDFNGVLDTYDNMGEINPDNLNRLKYIAKETDSKIVISSSLKNTYYHTGHLGSHLKSIIEKIQSVGIEVIDITPLANTREEEIKLYLKNHPEIENFCIIDDDYEMKDLENNLVKLPSQMENGQMGLDNENMYKAIEILKDPCRKQSKK